MKFHSQRASHMEPSATSTTVNGPVGERLQVGTEHAPVLDRPAPLGTGFWFMILAPDINIPIYLLTYLPHPTTISANVFHTTTSLEW